MVSTRAAGRGKTENRKRRDAARGPRAAADAAEPAVTGRAAGRGPGIPVEVGARAAARRIRTLAELCATLEPRRRLRRLAGQVARGPGNVQRMTYLETEIGGCLELAAESAGDRWLSCEAATWALAWMARTKRAGGSAGGLLERLVRQADAARAALANRDTASARFVLVLARLFADIEACRRLEEPAAKATAEEIGRLVTAAGAVGLSGSPVVLERVVRWTTIREVALATGPLPWSEDIEARWSAAAAWALRLLGRRGRILMGAGSLPACFSRSLLDAVAGRGTGGVGRAAARTARGLRAGRSVVRPLDRACHDAEAAVAVLRSGWGRGDVRVLLEYRDPTPRIEVAVDDRILFAGGWQWSVAAAGRPLDAEAAWTVSCWEVDRRAAFFEIVAPLTGGMQLERQVVVLSKARVVLLADAVRPRPEGDAAPQELRYRGVLPPASGLDCAAEAETREVVVSDTGTRCMVLPLALPEWRTAGRGGFTVAADGLALEQHGAVRLSAPLWIDCDAARIGRPRTWRQLTVADTRQILPPHQAVGFRVQAGCEQWLVYRALDLPRNRTLLGCNVSCEFLVGRVKKSGAVARTLEIQ